MLQAGPELEEGGVGTQAARPELARARSTSLRERGAPLRVRGARALGAVVALLALIGLAHSSPPEPPPSAPPAARRLAPPEPGSLDAGPSAAAAALSRGEPIDPNAASASELELLPGIGPTLARRIVEDRLAHGPYGRVEELTRVRGIGPRTLARLQTHLRIDPVAVAQPPHLGYDGGARPRVAQEALNENR